MLIRVSSRLLITCHRVARQALCFLNAPIPLQSTPSIFLVYTLPPLLPFFPRVLSLLPLKRVHVVRTWEAVISVEP